MFTLSRLSLRTISVLAALFMALLFGGLSAFVVTNTMAESDTVEAGQLAAGSAGVVAGMLDANLVESAADLAHLRNLLEDAQLWTDLPRLTRWIESLQASEEGYAWLGFTDAAGRVVAGTQGLAVGADVSKRTWYLSGLNGTAYGDLHEAMLLQKALPTLPEGEPWRFIDVSLPVRDAQGKVKGVLAAHLSWPWLRDTLNLASTAKPYEGSVWLVGPDNKCRLGHDPAITGELRLQALDLARAGKAGWLVESWPDGKRYVTGYAPVKTTGPSGALGWVTLVRAPADTLSPTNAEEMRDTLLVLLAGMGLIGLAAWWGTTLWLHPLRTFMSRVGQMRDGQRPPPLPQRVPQEFHELNLAILRLVDRLEEKEAIAQRSLVTVQDSFRSVGSSIPGTLSTFRFTDDAKLQFTFLSSSTELYYGVTPEEILDDPRTWARHVHPDDRAAMEEAFRRQFTEGGRSVSLPLRVRGGDGQERTLQLTLIQRDTESGLIFDTISLDITELQRARDQAVQANRAKSDFLATMSHELRTPLNAILGFAQVLESTLERPEQRQQVRYVRETGETLTRILNDVLDIAKIEAGKFDLDPRPFAMDQVLDSCASVFRVVSAEKKVGFDVRVPDDLPRLVGDPVRLRQILHNLLSNAFKFTAKGQVGLDLRIDPIADAPDGQRRVECTLEVRDTGLGLTHEQIQRLFQRFEQANRSISGQYGGTGLGLAIVKALVEKMEGRIEVESRHGQGTCFTLRLPFVVAPAEERVSAEAQKVEAPLHVLVVDDFHINRTVLRALLERRGHRVTEAEDGVQAVEKVSALHPDLVLMDLDMPNMDGLEATRRIRRLPVDERAMTPVYALTGKAFADDIAETRAAGMNGHLAKPVQQDELVRVLRAINPQGAAS